MQRIFNYYSRETKFTDKIKEKNQTVDKICFRIWETTTSTDWRSATAAPGSPCCGNNNASEISKFSFENASWICKCIFEETCSCLGN